MADVSAKPASARKATARGRIAMGQEAFVRLREGTLRKGDPLPQAEIAALQGAKRTAEWIPLCHPLPIDHVAVRMTLEEATRSVAVEVEVHAFAKTGVEMEALTGVSNALLALYDVIKADDPALTISEIVLLEKSGGKSGDYRRDAAVPPATGARLRDVRACVVTVSDRVSRGEAEDKSGPALCAWLEAEGAKVESARVPDERAQIAEQIKNADADLMVLTGGTGLAPRDVTPEAVSDACDRLIPGFGEAFRAKTSIRTDKAWLSRAVAGMRGQCLVLALPGSEKAVREGLAALGPLLAHALHIARGGGH